MITLNSTVKEYVEETNSIKDDINMNVQKIKDILDKNNIVYSEGDKIDELIKKLEEGMGKGGLEKKVRLLNEGDFQLSPSQYNNDISIPLTDGKIPKILTLSFYLLYIRGKIIAKNIVLDISNKKIQYFNDIVKDEVDEKVYYYSFLVKSVSETEIVLQVGRDVKQESGDYRVATPELTYYI